MSATVGELIEAWYQMGIEAARMTPQALCPFAMASPAMTWWTRGFVAQVAESNQRALLATVAELQDAITGRPHAAPTPDPR